MHAWQLLLVVETLMTDLRPRRYLQVLAEPNAVEKTCAAPASGSWTSGVPGWLNQLYSGGLRCHGVPVTDSTCQDGPGCGETLCSLCSMK